MFLKISFIYKQQNSKNVKNSICNSIKNIKYLGISFRNCLKISTLKTFKKLKRTKDIEKYTLVIDISREYCIGRLNVIPIS